MTIPLRFALALGIAASSSASTSTAAASVPPPAVAPASAEALARHQDAARILGALRAAGLDPVAGDESKVEMLAGAPGYVWRVGPEWLHLHLYPGAAAAAKEVAGFRQATDGRTQIIDWVAKPHLYQCGRVVALYLGEDARALAALAGQCGVPIEP